MLEIMITQASAYAVLDTA